MLITCHFKISRYFQFSKSRFLDINVWLILFWYPYFIGHHDDSLLHHLQRNRRQCHLSLHLCWAERSVGMLNGSSFRAFACQWLSPDHNFSRFQYNKIISTYIYIYVYVSIIYIYMYVYIYICSSFWKKETRNWNAHVQLPTIKLHLFVSTAVLFFVMGLQLVTTCYNPTSTSSGLSKLLTPFDFLFPWVGCG